MTTNRFLAALFFGLIVLALTLWLFWALTRNDTRIVSALLLLVAVTLVWLEVHDRLGRRIRRQRAGPLPLGQPLLIRARPSAPDSLASDLGPLLSAENAVDVSSPHWAASLCDPCSTGVQDSSAPDSSAPECSPPSGDSGGPRPPRSLHSSSCCASCTPGPGDG